MASQYATVAIWTKYLDARLLAEISSDTDADVTANESNAVLLECLQAASADVESYARVGGRYNAAKLAELYAAGERLLISTVIGRAGVYLYARRGGDMPPAIAKMANEASRNLEGLRNGERIFGDIDAESAGATEMSFVTRNVRANRGFRSDSVFFPARSDRMA